jgi:hypothetical protein
MRIIEMRIGLFHLMRNHWMKIHLMRNHLIKFHLKKPHQKKNYPQTRLEKKSKLLLHLIQNLKL